MKNTLLSRVSFRAGALALGLLVAGGLAGCGTKYSKTSRLTAHDNGRVMQLTRHQTFTVSLPANHIGAYRWVVANNAEGLVQAEGNPKYSADLPETGGGGRELWHFRAMRSGRATLRLEYRKPWSKEEKPKRTVEYILSIK